MARDQSTFDLGRLIGLLDRGRTGEAIEIATELVREMPGHVTGHVVRARAFESQGDFREALLSWRTALDLVPNSPLIQKGLRRTAEKLALSDDFPAASGQPMPHDYDDLSGEASLPGFQSVDSMFDVEPEFERLLAEDLSADVPETVVEPRENRAPSLDRGDLEDSGGPHTPHGSSHFPDARPDDTSDTRGHQDLSVDAAYAAVIELESAPVDDPAVEESMSDDLTADVAPAQEANVVATDDLDGLIAELSSARITPADRSFPAPNLDTPIDDVATETLARIFAEQKQYQDAARVYAKLAVLHPNEKDEFLRRASEMRSRAGRA